MKKIIKAVAFLALLALVLGGIFQVMKFKHVDGIYPLKIFYELPRNSCDAMFFGTSHTFEGINPALIWKETGIPAFVLAGSSQPTWSTYYYIKEALKYQSPKVLVLDVDGTYIDSKYDDGKYNDYSRIVKNTIGLRLSLDKLAAISVNAPREQWLDMLLGFPTYHTRYTELGEQDFTGYWERYPDHWKGYCEHTGHTVIGTPDVTDVTEPAPIVEKAEYWLREIIELCQERGVPLLLVSIPYSITDKEQAAYLYVADIAEEYGVPFINFNADHELLDINFRQDMGDDQHLNYKGASKMTVYIAHYLAENYDLADKRGTSDIYDSWDANLDFDTLNHSA